MAEGCPPLCRIFPVVKGAVANTDFDWYQFCRARPHLGEVNFWRPGTQNFKALLPGEPFFFKLKAPRNSICGFGRYSRFAIQPVWRAWDLFGDGNGAPTQLDLLRKLAGLSGGTAEINSNREIGCVAVADPVFFEPDDWVKPPDDWSRNIVSFSGYELSSGEGARIFRECLERSEARDETPGWVEESIEDVRRGRPVLIRPRLGQGSFRLAVLDAYGGACAVTTEHSLPAVEASHIRPFHMEGSHEVSNGIPLRRDIHRLFDLGFVTITPDRKFRVSPALEHDYANGKAYYAMEGQPIIQPQDPDLAADREALAWHGEEVFRT